ncbi:MAG: hypothetical protein HY678_12280 [Chloroflexi bacterium]|nr:hypothetical protein [Chloroflexota bacterium]
MDIKFSVRQSKKDKDVVEVRYDCSCGCHPNARYRRGSADAAHEHCCCGIAHFAGADAAAQLERYLSDRRLQGIDPPEREYSVQTSNVRAPWGEELAVAYAIPKNHG